jgi:hypothetical protein
MRRTKVEWMGIVENYRSSGLTVRRFCKSEGIAEQSLRNWISRTDKGDVPERNHGFIEVQKASASEHLDSAKPSGLDAFNRSSGLTINFPNGTFIEVHPGTDRSTLEWVLALMAKRI